MARCSIQSTGSAEREWRTCGARPLAQATTDVVEVGDPGAGVGALVPPGGQGRPPARRRGARPGALPRAGVEEVRHGVLRVQCRSPARGQVSYRAGHA